MKIDAVFNLNDFNERHRLSAHVLGMRGAWRFEVKEHKPRRSDSQNRYYWGVVVKQLRMYMIEQGENWDAETAHNALRSNWLTQDLLDPKTGRPIGSTVRSTSGLTTQEFCDYIDNCIAWLADFFGIVVPDPAPWYQREGVLV